MHDIVILDSNCCVEKILYNIQRQLLGVKCFEYNQERLVNITSSKQIVNDQYCSLVEKTIDPNYIKTCDYGLPLVCRRMV